MKEDYLYHLGLSAKVNGEYSFAPVCLTTGSKGRTWSVGQQLADVKWWGLEILVEEDRGLLCCTGKYNDRWVSCFSSGMGGPSLFITFREAVMAGARIIIRVGSGGAIGEDMQIGQVVVGRTAYLWDAASALLLSDDDRKRAFHALANDGYFSSALKLQSNRLVTDALAGFAKIISPSKYLIGTEFSAADFWTEQARANLFGKVPSHIQARHQLAESVSNAYYSMELGPGLAWCKGEGDGLPMGCITTMYAQRAVSEKAQHADDALAIRIALNAAISLYDEPALKAYISREIPAYIS